MPTLRYDEAVQDPRYAELDGPGRSAFRAHYFEKFVRPKVPQEKLEATYNDFNALARQVEPKMAFGKKLRGAVEGATQRMAAIPKAVTNIAIDTPDMAVRFGEGLQAAVGKRVLGGGSMEDVVDAYRSKMEKPTYDIYEQGLKTTKGIKSAIQGKGFKAGADTVTPEDVEGLRQIVRFHDPKTESTLEAVFAGPAAIKSGWYSAADRFKKYPNVSGSLKAMGEAAEVVTAMVGLKMMGKAGERVGSAATGRTLSPMEAGLMEASNRIKADVARLDRLGEAKKTAEKIPDSRRRESVLNEINAEMRKIEDGIPEVAGRFKDMLEPEEVAEIAERKQALKDKWLKINEQSTNVINNRFTRAEANKRFKAEADAKAAAKTKIADLDAKIAERQARPFREFQEPPTILEGEGIPSKLVQAETTRPAEPLRRVTDRETKTYAVDEVTPDYNYLQRRATEKLGGEVLPPEKPFEGGAKLAPEDRVVDQRKQIVDGLVKKIDANILQLEEAAAAEGGRSPKVLSDLQNLKNEKMRVISDKFDPTLENILEGKTGRSALAPGEQRQVRTISNIVKDVNDAMGEGGFIDFSGKEALKQLTLKQLNARKRLAADWDQVAKYAKKIGKETTDVLKDLGFDAASASLIDAARRFRDRNKPEPPEPGTLTAHRRANLDAAMKKKTNTGDITQGLKESLIEQIYENTGTTLKRLTDAGFEEAAKRYNLIRGASTKANMIIKDATKTIYGGLKGSERVLLDEMINSNTIIEIAKRKPDHKFSGNWTAADHAAWLKDGLLKDIQRDLKLSPEQAEVKARQLQSRVDLYYKTMREQLGELHEKGLIDTALYKHLLPFNYSPMEFLDKVDPSKEFSGKVSVPDSGIKRLKGGDVGFVELNSEVLLRQLIARNQARIFKNEANTAMYRFAKDNPNNGLIRLASPKEFTPKGMERISATIEGKPIEMFMPEKMAEHWTMTDPVLNRAAMEFWGAVSGTKLLKAGATGYNPGFILTNTPRDILMIYQATEQYSAWVPKFLAEMAIDIATVAPDAIMKKGRFKDAINEGIGMETLTDQGSLFKDVALKVQQKLTGNKDARYSTDIHRTLETVDSALSYFNALSENLTRLALRERALKNGLDPWEATWEARNYLDFNKYGTSVKQMDSVLPYFNAGVQATRGLGRAAVRDPALFAFKAANIATMSALIYFLNQNTNPEAMEGVSTSDKVGNWILALPKSYSRTDKDGVVRHKYVKIAKDQGQRMFSTFMDAVLDFNRTGDFSEKELLKATTDLLSVVPVNRLPPVMSAFIGAVWNIDTYRWEEIVNRDYGAVDPSAERNERTHPFFAAMGDLTKGSPFGEISPMRAEYAAKQFTSGSNFYLQLGGYVSNTILNALSDEDRTAMQEDLNRRLPALTRVLGETPNVTEKQRDAIKKAGRTQHTEKKIIKDEFRKLSDLFFDNRTPETMNSLLDFIRQQPPETQKDLAAKLKDAVAMDGVVNKWWWIKIKQLPPEARALVFHERLKSANQEEKQQLISELGMVKGIASERFNTAFKSLLQNEGE